MSFDPEIIRKSFEKAKPIAGDVATKFYENLLEDNPELKPMFSHVNFDTQKTALINSLVFIVENIENTDKLVPYLEKMGARHVGYGTKEEHYPMVGGALIKTFAHFFGADWTQDLEDNWKSAYGVITECMLKGAADYVPELSDIQKRAERICRRMLMNELEKACDRDLEAEVRAKVRRLMMDTLDSEGQQLERLHKAA